MYFVVIDEYLKKNELKPKIVNREFKKIEEAISYIKDKLSRNPLLEGFILNENKYVIKKLHNEEYWDTYFQKYIHKYYVLLIESSTGIVLDSKKNRIVNNEYDYLVFNSLKESVLFCKNELNTSIGITYLLYDKKYSYNNDTQKVFGIITSYYPTVEEVERKRVLAKKEKKENSILNKIKRFLKKIKN